MYLNKMKKLNTVVKDKVSGKLFQITAITPEGLTLNEVEQDENGEYVASGTTQLTVTEDNSICFRFYDDPDKTQVPQGYTVKKGILLQDGKPATEQGEYRFDSLYGAVRNGVILKGYRTSDPEEKMIIAYLPGGDRFKVVYTFDNSSEFKLIEATEEAITFAFNSIRKATVEKDGKEVKYNFFDGSGLFRVNALDYTKETFLEFPLDLSEENIKKTDDGKYFVLNYYDVDANDDGDVITEFKYDGKMVVDTELNNDGFSVEVDEDAVAVVSPMFGLTFIGKNQFEYKHATFDSPVFAELGKHNILVDVNANAEGTRLVFAAADHTVKTVQSKVTSDRGTIYTVK